MVKEWQEGLGALIGALIGLSGLMAVEIVRRVLERRDSRAAAASVLMAEFEAVGRQLDVVAGNLLPASHTEAASAPVLELSPPQRALLIREASAPVPSVPAGIELLHPDVSGQIVKARLAIDALRRDLQALLVSLDGRKVPWGTSSSARQRADAGEIAVALARSARESLDEARNEIDRALHKLSRARG